MYALIIALLLFSPSLGHAGWFQDQEAAIAAINGASAPSPSWPANCLFIWTGDVSGDTDKGYVGDYSTTLDGTNSGGTLGTDYGQVGNGYRTTAQNQYLTWVNTADNIIDDSVGTVWMSVRFADATPTATQIFFESAYNSNNRIYLQLLASGRLQATYQGNSLVDQSSSGTGDTIPDTGWHRVAMSWDQPNGKLTWKIDSGSWYGITAGTLDAFTTATDDVTFGENAESITFTETVDIDNGYILSTYQAADPYAP